MRGAGHGAGSGRIKGSLDADWPSKPCWRRAVSTALVADSQTIAGRCTPPTLSLPARVTRPGADDEIHTSTRIPERGRSGRHRLLATLQYPSDERRQLPQL